LLRNPNWGGQGPTWAVEPYDDDDDGLNVSEKRVLRNFFDARERSDRKLENIE
jgi:hypothetical protein